MQHADKYISLTWLLANICLLFTLFQACHKDDQGLTPANKEVTITFAAELPKVSGGLRTYAMDNVEETELEDVDILVYIADGANWKFHYRTVGKIGPVTSTGNGGGTVDIEVTLWKTQVDSRLIILANARQQLNAYPFVTGELLTVLQENLVYELGEGEPWPANFDTINHYMPLPMWAEHPVTGGINESMIILPGDIKLLRSLARVDVMADAVEDNFTLDRVYVFNSNRNGLIIPGTDLTNPSLPSVLLKNDNDILDYDVTIGNKLEGEIYLFEAAAGTGDGTFPPDPDATALVIEGRFDGDGNPYFYRIDFKDVSNMLIPLLRNYRYRINITTATLGGGELTKEDAFEAGSLDRISFNPMGGFTRHSAASAKYNGVVSKNISGLQYTVTTINEQD